MEYVVLTRSSSNETKCLPNLPSLGFKIQTFVSLNEIKHTHKNVIIHAFSNKITKILCMYF